MQTKNLMVICTTVLVALTVFWPTLYRYDKDGDLLVRTNRVTGATAIFLGRTWRETSTDPPKSVALPPQELAKITGNAGMWNGTFSGKIYNGSDWTITRVYVLVTAKEVGGEIRWRRKMSSSAAIGPLETVTVSIPVTGDENLGSQEWDIEGAEGYARK